MDCQVQHQGRHRSFLDKSLIPNHSIKRGNNRTYYRINHRNKPHITLSSSKKPNHTNTAGKTSAASTSIWVPRNDVVEIFDSLQSSVVGLDKLQLMVGHNRIPVMILLMDPTKHTYEIMQIWVDRSIDSIRDLVHALQHTIPVDKWRQAYDGIFQVRGQRFTQLINIIRLVKYDIQPFEVLIAKPWSMTAKVT